MNQKTISAAPQPGDVIHATRAVTWITFKNELAAIVLSDVVERGQSVLLTRDSIEANGDILADLDSEDGPLRRGPWPEDEPAWTYGSPEWSAARDAARTEAWAKPNPGQRAAALAEVERVYGKAMPTSKTLGQLYGGRDVSSDNPVPRPWGDAA